MMHRQSAAKKIINVRVTTMDADLEFSIDRNSSGRDLFDQVCRTIGLREVWHFGLQFTNSKGDFCWLKGNKKVPAQVGTKPASGAPYHFLFLAKFFPEDVTQLIQDITQHLFFLQLKQAILNMDVYCPPEASVLLASYALQAKYGDYDLHCQEQSREEMLRVDELLPSRVIEQYQMTAEMWQERILTWWANNKGYTREDAEMEYLKISQDLDMFGVTYFAIQNKNGTDLYLGVTPGGLHIYEKSDKLHPKTTFSWADVSTVSFKQKKFIIKTQDKDAHKVTFISQSTALNKGILDLCVGYHNLYLRRGQPDSLELQQMKAQAKEERLRKQEERIRLEQEQNARTQLEQEREQLQNEIVNLKQQVQLSQETIGRAEETADLLAEKARISEEESLVLAKRASEAEAEIQRMRITALTTEQEKILMEHKAREAQVIAARIIEESEKRVKESEKLKEDLLQARQAEHFAKEKLRELMINPYMPLQLYAGGAPPCQPNSTADLSSAGPAPGQVINMVNPLPASSEYSLNYPAAAPGNNPNSCRDARGCLYDIMAERDIKSLSAEIEKERVEYIEKSRHLQEQLSDLRSEIEGLKVEERESDFDRAYTDHFQRGDTKYSTLRKSGAGSAKSRIDLFEGL